MSNTHRQDVREARAAITKRAHDKRISIDDIRREKRQPDAVFRQVNQMVSEPTPRLARERLVSDIPPDGAFDGSNQNFDISSTVLGNNIIVLHTVQATGTTTKLTRTSSPAPAAGSFYFDDVQTVRVGTAPAASDMLVVIYLTPR